MLPKKNRAGTSEVNMIFKGSSSLSSPSLSFKYLKSGSKDAKISFIAPKSVAKLAVDRNLLRRRGYAALAKYINQFPPGITGVFIFKTRPNDRSVGREYQDDIPTLENEIKDILNKIN